MRKYKAKAAIGVIVAVLMVLATMVVVPTPIQDNKNTTMYSSPTESKNTVDVSPDDGNDQTESCALDQYVRMDPSEEPVTANLGEEENDAGYNTDTGDSILKSLPLYPGEIKDGAPGRGTTGQLDPSGDKDDWYYFSACEGQKISIKITPESNFDVELVDYEATQIAVSENTGTTAES
ncbi:MAG: hypothetical protein U9O96_04470, partial [Candidatus Thermoplasmatota archaeon]|nr:hypothetical protein [Candidatus Thermoplasmatota archaeon]